jgi:hypothetical protein
MNDAKSIHPLFPDDMEYPPLSFFEAIDAAEFLTGFEDHAKQSNGLFDRAFDIAP